MTAAHLKAPERSQETAGEVCWKFSFDSEADARARAVGGGINARPYHCKKCGKWHLSSKHPADFRRQIQMARGER